MALLEGYTQILWLEPAAAQMLVSFVSTCCVIHPHVAASMSEFWVVIKEMKHDSKLPVGAMEGLLRQFALPIITALVRFGRLDDQTGFSTSEDPAAELVQRREVRCHCATQCCASFLSRSR